MFRQERTRRSTGHRSEQNIEGVMANKLSAIVTFIDFEKASDSVQYIATGRLTYLQHTVIRNES